MVKKEDFPLFTFRVLIGFDSGYNTFVARCLETGSVATAGDAETAEDMIKELLMDELKYALEHDNLANLYSSPAPIDVWLKFRQATQDGVSPIPMQRAVRAREEEVSTEIKIAQAG
jgi:hypothetical protein